MRGHYLSFTIANAQNPPPFRRVCHNVREKGTLVMLRTFASTALVLGTLWTASMPSLGLAQNHGSRSGGNRGNFSRGSSGGNRSQSFASPRAYEGHRGYSGGSSYYGRGY